MSFFFFVRLLLSDSVAFSFTPRATYPFGEDSASVPLLIRVQFSWFSGFREGATEVGGGFGSHSNGRYLDLTGAFPFTLLSYVGEHLERLYKTGKYLNWLNSKLLACKAGVP